MILSLVVMQVVAWALSVGLLTTLAANPTRDHVLLAPDPASTAGHRP